jgi:hypothetical protein
MPESVPLVLAGSDRDSGAVAQIGQQLRVVAVDGLFEPSEIVLFDSVTQLYYLIERVPVVGVNHQFYVFADGFANGSDARGITSDIRFRTTHHHLQPSLALRDEILSYLDELVFTVLVEPEGHIRLHGVLSAAKESPDGLSQMLAFDIPTRRYRRH